MAVIFYVLNTYIIIFIVSLFYIVFSATEYPWKCNRIIKSLKIINVATLPEWNNNCMDLRDGHDPIFGYCFRVTMHPHLQEYEHCVHVHTYVYSKNVLWHKCLKNEFMTRYLGGFNKLFLIWWRFTLMGINVCFDTTAACHVYR